MLILNWSDLDGNVVLEDGRHVSPKTGKAYRMTWVRTGNATGEDSWEEVTITPAEIDEIMRLYVAHLAEADLGEKRNGADVEQRDGNVGKLPVEEMGGRLMLNDLEVSHVRRHVFNLIGAACVDVKRETGSVSVDELLKNPAVRDALEIAADAYCVPGVREKELSRKFVAARGRVFERRMRKNG